MNKDIVAAIVVICITVLQIIAWIYGFDGNISQLLGVVYGAILAYYFAVKVNISK